MLLKLIYLSCALMVVLLTTKFYALAAETAPSSPQTTQIAPATHAHPATDKATQVDNRCATGGCGVIPDVATNSHAPSTTARPAVSTAKSEAVDSDLAKDLSDRKVALDREATALAQERKMVEAANDALAHRMDALTDQKNQLSAAQKHAVILSNEDSNRLVKIYETMRPADAAAIFNVLDLRVSVPLLKQMNPRKTSAIMALMSPQRAILATQLLVSGDRLQVRP